MDQGIYTGRISAYIYQIIIVALLIAIIGFGFFYFNETTDNKVGALYGGLMTGFILVLIQFFFAREQHILIEKIRKLGVVNIRSDRDDRKFYENLISSSKERIDVLGVTSSRFLEHFADDKSHRDESKVLLQALKNGVKVRILITKPDYLAGKDKNLAENAQTRLESIKQEYGNFYYEYFDHLPVHSIFRADKACLVGPVFPNVSSKDSPCVHLDVSSDYAKRYLQYFESEWNLVEQK